jgi:hypothetical protein
MNVRPMFVVICSLITSATIDFITVARGADTDKGWVSLLRDDDLSLDWTTSGNWSIKDGVATLTPREGEKGWSRWSAYLWSKTKYKDFEIEFDYLVQTKGNSGFYFRVEDKNDPVAKGIEVQIYDSSKALKLTDHSSGGVIPGIPPTKNAAKAAGEWNHFHITNKNNTLIVKLNGEVVNEVELGKGALASRPATGWIGFQDHALPLSLRNIKIRQL